MTKDVVCVNEEATVEEAAIEMRDRNVGCVVIVDDEDKVVGILTDRQIALQCVAEGQMGGDLMVSDIMTPDPVCVTTEDNIFTLIETMRTTPNLPRRIPVVDEDETLVGLVSVSDIAVVAKALIDEVLREDLRNSLELVEVETGGKRILEEIGGAMNGTGFLGATGGKTGGRKGGKQKVTAGGRSGGTRRSR